MLQYVSGIKMKFHIQEKLKSKIIDYIKNIYQSDIVILLATEATLVKFPYRFFHVFIDKYNAGEDSYTIK
jgi:hypothetical protein